MTKHRANQHVSFRLHIFPIGLFLIFSVVFLALWRQTIAQHDAELTEKSRLMADQAAIRLETYFQTRFQILAQLKQEWLISGPYTKDLFERRTEVIQEYFTGFLAINYIDPQGVIRWVTPEGPNRKALGLNLAAHPNAFVSGALAQAMRRREAGYTPPIVLAQGGLGVVIYLPLLRDGRLEGILNGVFRIEPMVLECFNADIIDLYDFRIHQGNSEVFRNGGQPHPSIRGFVAESTFDVGGHPWRIALNPRPENLPSVYPKARFWLLILGQCLSLFLALGLHFMFRHHTRLIDSETRYGALFKNAGDAILLIDQLAIVDCNPKTYELFNCTPKDLPRLAFNLFEHLPGRKNEAAVVFKERTREAMEGNTLFFEGAFEKLDGDRFEAEIYLNALVIDDHKMVQMIIRDISARKQTERRLVESEEKYRLLVESAADAIFIESRHGLKFANPKALSLTGYSEESLRQKRFIELIETEDHQKVSDFLDQLEPGATPIQVQMTSMHGDALWLLVSAAPLLWQDEECALIFARDITHQKTLETRLHHSQKMESIGTLAGGIAHDFNNLLMGIQGYTSLLLVDPEITPEMREKLQAMEQQIKSGAGLTRQLLGFARGGKYDVQPIRIVDLVETSSQLFGRTHKELTIHQDFDNDICAVEVDRTQMEQVLLNLYLNAWQAMGARGHIYLTVRNVSLDASFCAVHELTPGTFVLVQVRDTGEGMDAATQRRVFEPFFSKRQRGRGTGLGLASAYGIVKNHGGAITVESSPGKGAVFDIYLPTTEKTVPQEERQMRKVTPGTGTILIVDDESMILDVGAAMLGRLGYKVLVAESATEALKVFGESWTSIDLVILDMIMPDQSGAQLYEHLVAVNPEVKVLLSSGYSLNDEASDMLERGVNGFIQKPYTLSSLSGKVQEVLGDSETA